MRRSVRKRFGLLLAAVAVLAFAGWQWRHDAQKSPGLLLPLDPASITHVSLRIGSTPAENYSRRDGHWYRVDGTPVRADDGRLGELTETTAASVLRWRPASDFDPARIGLQPPAATLTLDGHVLDFGEMSVTGPQCYVRAGNRVALISIRYMPRPARAQATKLP
jgi:hypothetical protein